MDLDPADADEKRGCAPRSTKASLWPAGINRISSSRPSATSTVATPAGITEEANACTLLIRSIGVRDYQYRLTSFRVGLGLSPRRSLVADGGHRRGLRTVRFAELARGSADGTMVTACRA